MGACGGDKPPGVQLVFEARGCRLEDVVVTGAGVEGEDLEAKLEWKIHEAMNLACINALTSAQAMLSHTRRQIPAH